MVLQAVELTTPAQQAVNEEVVNRRLPAEFLQNNLHFYYQVCEAIAAKKQQHTAPMMVSFNGAQGSGKSTITAFLKLLLKHQFQLQVIEVSIDDFYLTRQQRLELAQNVHPLLKTRGVPGTHDVTLARNTLMALMQQTDEPVSVPVFDKSIDDRCPQSDWKKVARPIDVLLFEGWCNHAPFEKDDEQLMQPVNLLEEQEDPQGEWRRYVNQHLQEYHKALFSLADMLVFLQVPHFEKVYEWRGEQERKLRDSSSESGRHVMSDAELLRFIQHYERITRACLKVLPLQADVVVKLAEDHSLAEVRVQGDG